MHVENLPKFISKLPLKQPINFKKKCVFEYYFKNHFKTSKQK